MKALAGVVVLAAALCVAVAGWQLRRWTWGATASIHYTPDINHDRQWGRYALDDGRAATGHWHEYGLLNQYDKMSPETPDWANRLEAAPLRMALTTSWSTTSPQQNVYRLLQFDTVIEIIGAIAAFGLVRAWTRRCNDSLPMAWWRGSVLGSIAAALFWLNPAIVLSAHGWPAWDICTVTIYLLAAWAAVSDYWLVVGIALGFGAMLNGQLTAIMPVFVFWALAERKPLSAIRLAIGVLVVFAIIALPWLLSYIPADALAAARAIQFDRIRHPWDVSPDLFDLPRTIDWPALCWVIGATLAAGAISKASSMGIVPRHLFIPKKNTGKMSVLLVASAIVAVAIIIWPWLLKPNRATIWIGLVVSVGVIAASNIVRRRALLLAAVAAVALLAAPSLFHGSYAWWTVGIRPPRLPLLSYANTDTLPALLVRHFGWANDQLEAGVFTIASHTLGRFPANNIDVSIRQLLDTLCTGLVCLTGIGIGLHARRRDLRLLTALAAPWLVIYLISTQVHERYLLLAAASACVCIGDSIGTAAVGLVLSLATLLTTLQTMLDQSPAAMNTFGKVLAEQFPAWLDADTGAKLHRLTAGATPDFGYALLLCGAVFLYLSLAPSRDRARLAGSPLTTAALPDDVRYHPHSESALESANL